MSEWHVLGLQSDPTPGDPVQTQELAGRLRQHAELAERNTARSRSLAACDGDLRMAGDYAPSFRTVLGELPTELAKLGKAYRGCGDAMSAYATSLHEAKSRAGVALRQGLDADDRYQGALREIRSVLPADRLALLPPGRRINPLAIETAAVGLDEGTKGHLRAVVRRAQLAGIDGDRARRLADEAARLRGDAETRCVQGIRTALDGSGIKNKSWAQKALDTVSRPFRSWDDFVNLCRNVALVVGTVALFVSGPVGWALMAAAVVLRAVVFADTFVKYARGQASLGALALDTLGLILIPGGHGLVSLTLLGGAVRGMAVTLRSGGGRMLAGPLHSLRSGVVRDASKGIVRDASKGKGNFGLGSATRGQADTAGRTWVGEGYTIASDGKTLVSADGLRQYRPPTYKPTLGLSQANFEQRFVPRGQWQSNGHLDILD